MAKEAGENRCSRWSNDPYTVNGKREEYYDLPPERQNVIKALSHRVADEMWRNLKDKSVLRQDKDMKIKIEFDHKGVNHVARDAMILLSGKYMSRDSMINIDRILANSSYMRTTHQNAHDRSDSRMRWYKYQDSQGRGLYFSVAQSSEHPRRYTLYSVSDRPPKKESGT